MDAYLLPEFQTFWQILNGNPSKLWKLEYNVYTYTHLRVACDFFLSCHFLNISTRCLAVFRGQLLSMSWISTFDNSRPVEIICHSEKHSVSLTRWASTHGLSRSSAENFDSCSSRLRGLTTTQDTPPSAMLSTESAMYLARWLCPELGCERRSLVLIARSSAGRKWVWFISARTRAKLKTYILGLQLFVWNCYIYIF